MAEKNFAPRFAGKELEALGWEGREGRGEERLPPAQPFHTGWVRAGLQESFRAFREEKLPPLVFYVLSSLHPLSFHAGLRIYRSIGLRKRISTQMFE